MREKEIKEKHRRRKGYDFEHIDSDSDDSDRNLNQLVLQKLTPMNISLATVHNLKTMKHFDVVRSQSL